MATSFERVQDADEVKQSSISYQTMTRYQALSQACYSALNRCTGGHAAEAIRLISFLFVGGLAALVNLGCVWVFARHTPLPYAFYTILATEISLLCNFGLNDRLTFRSLLDGQRSWWKRCLRFHAPATVGFVLTLLISDVAYYLGHLTPVFAQGLAIIFVTFVNFSMHRLWTYRPSHHSPKQQPTRP